MVTDKMFFIVVQVLFFICWILTLTFSLVIIIIIIRYWHTHTRSTANIFTCNSCLALIFHVLSFCIQIPPHIQRVYFNIDYINPYLCKISACLTTFSSIALSYSYLVRAISCFSLTILYKHKILQTFRFNCLLIVASWIVSGVIAFLLLLSPTAYQYEDQSRFCALTTKDFSSSILVISVAFILTMSTMIILYGYILYYTVQNSQINPNSTSTRRAKRNLKVLKKILMFVTILLPGGFPYFICIILNRLNRAPWQLYPIAFLFISFMGTLEAIALFITNKQVKITLLAKLSGRPINEENHIRRIPINRIVPFHAKLKSIPGLPVIA